MTRQVRAALEAVLARCDTFLPSGEELTLLTDATTPKAAISEILGLGVTAIVVKNGAEGATYYDTDGSRTRRAIAWRSWTRRAPVTASAPPSSPAVYRDAAWKRASITPTPAVPGL